MSLPLDVNYDSLPQSPSESPLEKIESTNELSLDEHRTSETDAQIRPLKHLITFYSPTTHPSKNFDFSSQTDNERIEFYSLKSLGEGSSRTVHGGEFASPTNPSSHAANTSTYELPQILSTDLLSPLSPRYALSVCKKNSSEAVARAQHGIAIQRECYRAIPGNIAEITRFSVDGTKTIMIRYRGELKYLFNRSEEQKTKVAFKICETIRKIHNLDIAHYDIKPENIRLNTELTNPYLIDFECAIRTLPDGSASPESLEITHGNTTEFYNAPQQQDTLPKQRDVYSLGVTLFYLFTNGEKLWDQCLAHQSAKKSSNQNDEELENEQLGKYLMITTGSDINQVIEKYIPNTDLRDLLMKMLTLDPAQRATMEDVVSHAFFRSASRTLLGEGIIQDLIHQAIGNGLTEELLEPHTGSKS